MSDLTARIAAAAAERVVVLAQAHAEDTDWASGEAHAARARRYQGITFQATGNTVLAITGKGATGIAADALDYAAGDLDNGDGYISTDTTESLVTYYTSEYPGVDYIIRQVTGQP